MLNSKQRAELRAKANALEPLFQVGKGGISDALIAQTEDALNARELIKLKVLTESCPDTPREVADKISAMTGADVVQVIGGCMIFYRESPELQRKLKEKENRKKELSKKAGQAAKRTAEKSFHPGSKYGTSKQSTSRQGTSGQRPIKPGAKRNGGYAKAGRSTAFKGGKRA